MSDMSIRSRLKRLETMRPARLVVLARMPDGEEREMSAPEFCEAVKNGADFNRCVRGTDLRDAALVLGTFPSVID